MVHFDDPSGKVGVFNLHCLSYHGFLLWQSLLPLGLQLYYVLSIFVTKIRIWTWKYFSESPPYLFLSNTLEMIGVIAREAELIPKYCSENDLFV